MLNGRYYLEREREGEVEGYEIVLNASGASKTHYTFVAGESLPRPTKQIPRMDGVRLIRTLKSAGFRG